MPYSPEGTLYRGPHAGVVEYEPHAAPSHIVHNVVPAPAPLVHDVIDHVPLGHHAAVVAPVHHEVIPVHHKAIHHAVHPNIIHDSYAPKPHHVVHAKVLVIDISKLTRFALSHFLSRIMLLLQFIHQHITTLLLIMLQSILMNQDCTSMPTQLMMIMKGLFSMLERKVMSTPHMDIMR